MLIVGISMVVILVHERKRIQKIETETEDIHLMRRDINAAHRHITCLATLGESVIGWEEADTTRYRTLRLRTDCLLQALKPHCWDYVRPAQIDTLRTLLAEKEAHLLHLTEILDRQNEADSLLVNHLPEVARRATRIRTVKQKKSGLAGVLGGKKTVLVLPSAKKLHQFSDSLIALQQRQTVEMDAYADSLRNRNRTPEHPIEQIDWRPRHTSTKSLCRTGTEDSRSAGFVRAGCSPSPYPSPSSCCSCRTSPSIGK